MFCLVQQQWWKMKMWRKNGIISGCSVHGLQKLQFIQWLQLNRIKYVSLVVWVEQCWQHWLMLSGFSEFALNLDKIWQDHYIFCSLLSHIVFIKSLSSEVRLKFRLPLSCLWGKGGKMGKGGLPQHNPIALHFRYEYT